VADGRALGSRSGDGVGEMPPADGDGDEVAVLVTVGVRVGETVGVRVFDGVIDGVVVGVHGTLWMH